MDSSVGVEELVVVARAVRVVRVVRARAAEDARPDAVCHPRQVEARVRLDEQVRHEQVVRDLRERVLGQPCAEPRPDPPEREPLHGDVRRDLRAARRRRGGAASRRSVRGATIRSVSRDNVSVAPLVVVVGRGRPRMPIAAGEGGSDRCNPSALHLPFFRSEFPS